MKSGFRNFILTLFLFYRFDAAGQWTVMTMPEPPDDVMQFFSNSLCSTSNWWDIYPLAADKHLVSIGCDPLGSSGGSSRLYHSADNLNSLVKKYELGGTMADKGNVELLTNQGDSIVLLSLASGQQRCYLTRNRFTTLNQLSIYGIPVGASFTKNYLYIQTSAIFYRCTPAGDILTRDTTFQTLNLVARRLSFISDSVGYMTGDTLAGSMTNLLRTTDMGKSWTIVYSAPADSLADFQAFPSGAIYLLKKDGQMLVSKNRGTSWQAKQSLPPGIYTCMRYFSEAKGLAGTTTGSLYSTADSCVSWTAEASNTSETIDAIYCFDNASYFVTDNGFEEHSVHAPVSQYAVLSQQSGNSLLSVFPNPTTGEVRVSVADSPTMQPLRVLLYNGMGQLVRNIEQNGASLTLDVGDLEQGLYLLQCSYSGKTETRRLVKL